MKKFSQYLQDRLILEDADDIIGVVRDYLEDQADEVERLYPYATNTVAHLRDAAQVVHHIRYDEEADE